MYILLFQGKPCLHLMNRLNSLKHMQRSDVRNSNLKKEKEKRKKSHQIHQTH